MTYYNDNDKKACVWLRELMKEGLISDGEVDDRPIQDIKPSDLAGFQRCHFFAGIGGWELALQLAGWPEERSVWTGSCPCPPFSCAGKKKRCPECGEKTIPHPRKTGIFACVECGHEWLADGRHLWPEFLRLIAECKPATVIGEQVGGADGLIWLAGVRATLEELGYGVGAADLCAAGVQAPHIRQRLYWVANSIEQGLQGHAGNERDGSEPGRLPTNAVGPVAESGAVDWTRSVWWPCRDGKWRRVPGRVADAALPQKTRQRPQREHLQRQAGADGGIPDAEDDNRRCGEHGTQTGIGQNGQRRGRPASGGGDISTPQHDRLDAERTVQPAFDGIPESMVDLWNARDADLFPLAPPKKGRTGILKGAGNAIVPQVAAEFIKAVMECDL